jgi:transposase InsO family protein
MGLRKWHHARLQPTRGADRQCPCEELQRHCATGVLGPHWFLELDDAREKVEEWRTEYNEVRPHSAIGERTPVLNLPISA